MICKFCAICEELFCALVNLPKQDLGNDSTTTQVRCRSTHTSAAQPEEAPILSLGLPWYVMDCDLDLPWIQISERAASFCCLTILGRKRGRCSNAMFVVYAQSRQHKVTKLILMMSGASVARRGQSA